jgi:hypothetical protein
MESRLTVIGVVLLAVGILLLAYMLRRVFKRISFKDTGEQKKKAPASANILLIILSLIFILLAQSAFWLSSQTKAFRPLNESGEIGRVSAEITDDPLKSLEISYTPALQGATGVENRFFLSGDSWRLSGEILHFKFARNLLKLPERCYKTTVFNGDFLATRPPSATGALFHTNEIEGGESRAFGFFRNTGIFKWFAEVDSFASDWITVEEEGSYELNIAPDGNIEIR